MFLGDYEEDSQLQQAIRILLTQIGTDADKVEEYRVVFAKTSRPAEPPMPGAAATGEPR